VLKAFLALDNRRDVEDDIQWGLGFVRRQVAAGFEDFRDSNWYGPGFCSAALDVLTLESRNQTAVAYLLERLAKMQDHACGFFGSAADSIDMRVFHTADSLRTLHAESMPPNAASIEQAIAWLEAAQDPGSGRWGKILDRMSVIFTAYAVLALADLRGVECPAVKNGLRWLRDRQDADGRVESLEGSVMALQCFAKVYHVPSSSAVPVRHLVELRSLLGDYERATETVRNDTADVTAQLAAARQELDAERHKYVFRLTHRRAAQIGWIVTIATGVLPFLVHWIPL
jgi:hypothetical protein